MLSPAGCILREALTNLSLFRRAGKGLDTSIYTAFEINLTVLLQLALSEWLSRWRHRISVASARNRIFNVCLTSLSFVQGPLYKMGIILSTWSTCKNSLKDRVFSFGLVHTEHIVTVGSVPGTGSTKRSLKSRWTDRPINRYFAYSGTDGDIYIHWFKMRCS